MTEKSKRKGRSGHSRRSVSAAGLAAAVVAGTISAQIGSAGAAPSVHGAAVGAEQAQLTSLVDRKLASVVAPNGDQNPYGIAVVPVTAGILTKGNLLVADFNNAANTAAGGTSILQVNPVTGATSVFYSGAPVAGPVGIAINPVNDGVWIGDYGAAQDGTGANDLLIAPTGAKVLANYDDTSTMYNPATGVGASFIGGWGQGVSQANGVISFYYGNAGNATTGTGGGDVWRLTPHPTATVSNGQPVNATYAQIAAGQAQTPAGGNAGNAAGPQGLAYDNASGTLYETNDASNTLYAIPGAATATGPVAPTVAYQGPALSSPENVTINPTNGDLLVVNAGNNNLVEITPSGQVVATRNLAPNQSYGALFGLVATTAADGSLVLYYTNDNDNSVHELAVPASGYRLSAADGGVFAFGGARFYGSEGGAKLNAPMVGMASTPDGGGYWMVASDGGVFSFGDARFAGSEGGTKLNAPIVGMASTPDGGGYWMVASDGGVFSLGDAVYAGSKGGSHLNAPITGIAAAPHGTGYWLSGADGSVFPFGDAGAFGSLSGVRLGAPIVGIAPTPDGGGYWITGADGGVFAFGDALYSGSLGGVVLAAPISGITNLG